MGGIIFKTNDKIRPNVTRNDSQEIVFYLDDEDDDVHIEETREMNFEEMLHCLEAGSSVFMTIKPREGTIFNPREKRCEKWL